MAAIDLILAALFLVVVGYIANAAWSATRVGVELEGGPDDGLYTLAEAETVDLHLRVSPTDRLDQAELTLDGRSILDEVEVLPDGFRWTPTEPPAQGEHRLELSVPRVLLPASGWDWSFTIDGKAPVIDVPTLLPPVPIDEAVTVSGRVGEDATLTADGQEVELDDDGGFELAWDTPPAGVVELVAVDAAGNRSTTGVAVPVERAMSRGVHVTAAAYGHDGLRQGIIDLIDTGTITAVELDLKDEAGVIGYDSQVPMAAEVGAIRDLFDLEEAVDYFHSRGVRVIGRLVAFRDDIFADAAWERGDHDMVVRRPDGSLYLADGESFANVANPEVRQYNIDIAMEAVEAGVDEILYDYARRPVGAVGQMVFAGMEGTVEQEVVDFLAESHPVLREAGALQGASVFGIAASRPTAIGQDIPSMARHVDYLAPMPYPALWVRGEYRVEHPEAQPYDIVTAALADFQEKMEGSGAQMVPWLQDFSLGIHYGPEQVLAQIRAAADLGIESWLLWDPRVTYTTGTFDSLPVVLEEPD